MRQDEEKEQGPPDHSCCKMDRKQGFKFKVNAVISFTLVVPLGWDTQS